MEEKETQGKKPEEPNGTFPEESEEKPKGGREGDTSAECAMPSAESNRKWKGNFSSAAEREALKEAADNKLIRDIERAETISGTKSKRIKVVIFAIVSVALVTLLGYMTVGLSTPAMPFAPVAAGILTWFIHKHHLNRFAASALFLIPGTMTFPIFYIGLAIAGLGAIVGMLSEEKYKQF